MDTGYVDQLRHALLALHKALMDEQRVVYERAHGRIATSGEFLGLVLEHPEFAWLRELSALIARLDELMEDEKASAEEWNALTSALRSLVQPAGRHAVFSAAYWRIVNDVPGALIEHVKLWRLLDAARPSP